MKDGAARAKRVSRQGSDGPLYDVVVVGGGVNGSGIARDAALRGLSVCLLEKGDFASGTSSYSSKLIHGGLRYLEFGAFSMVREALKERALLLKILPTFVRPLRLVLPRTQGGRPLWLVRLGLWLYDHLAPRGSLEKSLSHDLSRHEFGRPLKEAPRGFEFSDCMVDDARLVIFNVLEAAAERADIRPVSPVVKAARLDDVWQVTLEDGATFKGRVLINATGPFVNHFIEQVMAGFPALPLRLVRGSHIVVPKLYDHDRGYLLQMTDKRVIFALPFESHFTLIGTTEAEELGDLSTVTASSEEIDYLLQAARQHFKRALNLDDIVWSYAGVRPLVGGAGASARSLSRDYQLVLEKAGGAPVVHVYGGKITTFRALSGEVVDLLAPFFPKLGACRTHEVPYVAFEAEGFADWEADFHQKHSFLPPRLRHRYVSAYGRRADWFLRDVRVLEDMGRYFGGGLYMAELRYLIAHEWARTADDVLWRRTKCGLHMEAEQRAALKDWFAKEFERDRII